MAKQVMTSNMILSAIQKKALVPVYGLMGDEPYYIDQISNCIENTLLTEDERDFNLTVFYGQDTNIVQVIEEARKYPMMSEYRIVILKEAQAIKEISKLKIYLKHPLPSTILVIAYKYGKIERSLQTAISKVGVLFESKKLYDNKIPDWIHRQFQTLSISISLSSCQLMADNIGNDLTKIGHEIDKLKIAVATLSKKEITTNMIEKIVGVSKEYNNFELVKAILDKDVLKANKIVNYFESNPKKNPLVLSIAVLYNIFSNLVMAYSLQDRTTDSLVKNLGLRNSYATRDILLGLKNYSPGKMVRAVSLIREYDGKSKGLKGNTASDGELLRELVFKIIH